MQRSAYGALQKNLNSRETSGKAEDPFMQDPPLAEDWNSKARKGAVQEGIHTIDRVT